MISQEELELRTSLSHHGILGQKWGVRRFQNADGSLTSAGKKRVSSDYKKASVAGDKDLMNNYTRLYVNAHNKTADKLNSGGIEKFNAEQKKKHGDNFSSRKEYEEEYEKLLDKMMSEELEKTLYDFRISNTNYQKADALVQKYGMEKWDDLAKSNEAVLSKLRSKYS